AFQEVIFVSSDELQTKSRDAPALDPGMPYVEMKILPKRRHHCSRPGSARVVVILSELLIARADEPAVAALLRQRELIVVAQSMSAQSQFAAFSRPAQFVLNQETFQAAVPPFAVVFQFPELVFVAAHSHPSTRRGEFPTCRRRGGNTGPGQILIDPGPQQTDLLGRQWV